MGMDYQFAGSASYDRFDREIMALAQAFGGELNSDFQKRMNDIQCKEIHPFGIINVSEEDRRADKFVFPSGFDKIIAHWLNYPFDEVSAANTKHIYSILNVQPWVGSISSQICTELQQCCENECGWNIC